MAIDAGRPATVVPGRRDHSRTAALIGAALFVGLAVVVGLVDPNRPGVYPTCPVRALTGWACPGCGSLRALRALTQGDLLTALDRNAAMVLFLPVALVAWARTLTARRVTPSRARVLATVALVLLTAWTVARNLPYAPFTLLAP